MLSKNVCIGLAMSLLILSILGIPALAKTGTKEDFSIQLQSVKFDPVKSVSQEEPSNLFMSSYLPEIGSYILQFDGPVSDEYKSEVSDLGVKIYGYVPNYAFIARMDYETVPKVEALSFVRWVGIYQPAYKISPSALAAMKTEDTTIVDVLLFDEDMDVTSEIQALGGNIIVSSPGKMRVLIDSSKIADITNIDEIMWVEKYVMPTLSNNVSAQIMNVDPVVWSTHGLDGTGQIVAVADTGLDTGANDATMHDDLEGRIVSIHSWPIQPSWDPYVENDGADDGARDLDSGHGTHTSGSVLGNGSRSNGDIKGTAYGASLVFQAVEQWVNFTPASGRPDGYYLVGIPDNLNDLFQQAYTDGARIHSNSWGSDKNGEYTLDANAVDTFIWNHKDTTILFCAHNYGRDSNSDGVVDYGSIASPGTAKNVITVGASENVRSVGGYQFTWGYGWPTRYPSNPIKDDHLSNNSDGMAAFSGRGPCDDGRIKPDVVAPGTNVLSVRSSVATGTGWGIYDSYYMYMGGTSMSTPLTAGASALVRQYYMENRLHTPNAALIKATLINGAFDMPGQYVPDETGPTPNNNEGWGRVDLANSIFPTPPTVLLFNDSEFSLSTGQNQKFNYTITDTTVPLYITLVWSDYPAAVPAGGLVNDLDLIVTSLSGGVYHGNDFNPPFDDSNDRTNNVEQVRINSPELGVYEVNVTAYNIPNGPQDFAIVISGAAISGSLPVAEAGPDQTVEQDSSGGASVTLDGSGSYDLDGDPLTYSWTWTGGSSTGVNPTVVLPLGTTEITLTVDDGQGTDTDTVEITVVDTTAPVLTVPADVTVEQATADGTVVPLTATATDICDADVEITSDELAIYPLGITTVTFTATDDSGNSVSGTVVVTVVDTTAPDLTIPADVTVEQETRDGTIVELTATATDICDADVEITSDELAIYPLGDTTVTFTATDDSGNSVSKSMVVHVIDTTPPEISVTVSPDTLWSPNHKMVDISATVLVSDICDANPTVVLTSVTSDEPADALGDGNTINDIQGADIGTGDYEFKLRAERAGDGDGRVYTITYTATDASGNSATASATVVVPHNIK